MTALTYSDHRHITTVAKSIRRPSKLELLKRKRSLSQPRRRTLGSSKQKNSALLSRFRRNYASRGVSLSPPALLPISSFAEISPKSDNDSDLVNSTSPDSSVTEEPSVGLHGARRSVSLLKLRFCDYLEDEDTMHENCGDSDADMQSGDDVVVRSRPYRIKFNCYVKEVEIPHHSAYCPAQRMQLWNSSKKLREMVNVNRIEYDWEGNDWQNAPEEDEFCVIKGEMMHPAHLL